MSHTTHCFIHVRSNADSAGDDADVADEDSCDSTAADLADGDEDSCDADVTAKATDAVVDADTADVAGFLMLMLLMRLMMVLTIMLMMMIQMMLMLMLMLTLKLAMLLVLSPGLFLQSQGLVSSSLASNPIKAIGNGMCWHRSKTTVIYLLKDLYD